MKYLHTCLSWVHHTMSRGGEDISESAQSMCGKGCAQQHPAAVCRPDMKERAEVAESSGILMLRWSRQVDGYPPSVRFGKVPSRTPARIPGFEELSYGLCATGPKVSTAGGTGLNSGRYGSAADCSFTVGIAAPLLYEPSECGFLTIIIGSLLRDSFQLSSSNALPSSSEVSARPACLLSVPLAWRTSLASCSGLTVCTSRPSAVRTQTPRSALVISPLRFRYVLTQANRYSKR